MKKTILMPFLLFIVTVHMQAQSVSYTYHPFAEEGCSVSYTPTFVGDSAYIIVSVQSDRLVFSNNPTMMVRFFDTDQILQLEGKNMTTTTSNGAVVVSNVLVPYTELKAMAMFRVTEEDMEMFKLGVERIRLTTLPITHDRTFKKDRIGLKLYQNYQTAKRKAKNF